MRYPQHLLSILTGLLCLVGVSSAGTPARTVIPDYEPSFLLLRDTLFVLDSSWIEVRLDRQQIFQHFRDGRVRRYPCSTGDPRIKDGIATREGIFTIQWRSRRHMSTQFEVPLNFWMPFDGGIGFHGLQGRSYYRYLGRRASSHGCVRISNEAGAQIFRDSRRGTLVFVHSGSPARVLAFGDTAMVGLRILERVQGDYLPRRLEAVQQWRAEDTLLSNRLAISPGSTFATGIRVGRIDPKRIAQRRLPMLVPPRIELRTRQNVIVAVPELRKRSGAAAELISDRH